VAQLFQLFDQRLTALREDAERGTARIPRSDAQALGGPITWTRLAIVTFAADTHGFDTTATRLLQNQVDISNAFKPFYGDAAATRLASLLHTTSPSRSRYSKQQRPATRTASTRPVPAGTQTPTTSLTSGPRSTRASGRTPLCART
jgi:hypothetical protein